MRNRVQREIRAINWAMAVDEWIAIIDAHNLLQQSQETAAEIERKWEDLSEIQTQMKMMRYLLPRYLAMLINNILRMTRIRREIELPILTTL